MNMGYSIEKICENYSIVRIGTKHGKFGDPYDLCIIIRDEGNNVHVKGATGKLRNMKTLMYFALKEGFKTISWERVKNGNVKIVKVRISLKR